MSDVTVLRDPTLGEEVVRKVFPSGLTAYVLRKPGFTKSYATLATRYGSIDTRLPGPRGALLPDGVAHFLEHKVFEMPEGDAFDLFARRGAQANAFTSFASTAYLFGTSTDYAGNLRTLVDVVFDLHVDEQNVEKEKGIIGQEIAMYEDDPDWRIFFGAIQTLYRRHPVRIDIAGTKKTIAGITPELLREVHRAYYHPRNMVLAAVSPEPVETTFSVVDETLEARRFGRAPRLRRARFDEPAEVVRKRKTIRLPVARPRLAMGIKDDAPRGTGPARLRHDLAVGVALDALFGNSGWLYHELYEAGLVDDSFGSSYTAEDGFAFVLVGGETDDTARLKRALEALLARAAREGLDPDTFERMRNKELGGFARAFNSPERIAHLLVNHHMRGTTIPQYREALFALTRREVDRKLRVLLEPARRAYSMVEPR